MKVKFFITLVFLRHSIVPVMKLLNNIFSYSLKKALYYLCKVTVSVCKVTAWSNKAASL